MTWSQFLDFLAVTPRWQKIVVGLVLLVAFTSAGYLIAVLPVSNRVSSLRAQRDAREQEILRLRPMAAEVTRMRRETAEIERQLDMAKEAYPTKSYPSAGLLPSLRRQAASPGDAAEVPEGIAVGNPAHLIRELKKWEACGVDRVGFMLNAAEIIPQEQVLNSLRLFAKEVMPAFAETQPVRAAAAGGR